MRTGCRIARENRGQLVGLNGVRMRSVRFSILTPLADRASSKVDTGRDDLLAHHRQTQDALSNDLVNMAQALKANALNLGQLLDQDRKVSDQLYASPSVRTR